MSITTNRARFDRRVREDAQTWRDRLIGKRIVTADRHVASHTGWKEGDGEGWEPRIYYCEPPGTGLDKGLAYESQPWSPLLSLPAEIRNQVLEYVLPPAVLDAGGEVLRVNTSAVIFCCKQLYAEGRGVAVRLHTYGFEDLPRRVLLGRGRGNPDCYVWDLLNVVCDGESCVVERVYYG